MRVLRDFFFIVAVGRNVNLCRHWQPTQFSDLSLFQHALLFRSALPAPTFSIDFPWVWVFNTFSDFPAQSLAYTYLLTHFLLLDKVKDWRFN